MKVKIGDTIYNSDLTSMMIMIEECDMANMINITDNKMLYLFPLNTSPNNIRSFMDSEPIINKEAI